MRPSAHLARLPVRLGHPRLEPLEPRLLLTDVSGAVSGVWDVTTEPYRLVDTAYVPAGETLTIAAGVQQVEGINVSLNVNGGGTRQANGATFGGALNGIDITAYDGGTLELTNCTMAGGSYVEYDSGSSGTLAEPGLSLHDLPQASPRCRARGVYSVRRTPEGEPATRGPRRAVTCLPGPRPWRTLLPRGPSGTCSDRGGTRLP